MVSDPNVEALLLAAATASPCAKMPVTARPASSPATTHTPSWMKPVAAAARIFAVSSLDGSSVATSSSAMRLVFSSATDVMIDCALSRIDRYSSMTKR